MINVNINKDTFWDRNRKSGGYLLRKKATQITVSICRFILLFGLCFLILQPILNKISVSLMTEEDLFDPVVISIPLHFTMDNYKIAADVMNYKTAFFNSLIISLTTSILQIAMCTLVGYGFARFKFPLKKLWFAFVMLTIVIPPQVISTSLFLRFRFFDIFGIFQAIRGEALNLRGSIIPYYMLCAGCMGLKDGLYIYMIRQFFRNIPNDMEEAAYVDGCGMFKTFYTIMLPEATPIITSCFLFSFVWQWTDGFYANLFLGKIKLLAVNLGNIVEKLGNYLAQINGGTAIVAMGYSNAILSTATLMTIIPVIILYIFCQRMFVESLASTGVKM